MLLVELIGCHPFLGSKFRKLCHIGESTHMSVVEQDNFVVLGKLKVKFHEVTLVESSLNAG